MSACMQDVLRQPFGICDVQHEIDVRGGFFPLMHLFPSEASLPGMSIPWQPPDKQLQQWLANSNAYQAAAVDLETAHQSQAFRM